MTRTRAIAVALRWVDYAREEYDQADAYGETNVATASALGYAHRATARIWLAAATQLATEAGVLDEPDLGPLRVWLAWVIESNRLWDEQRGAA